MRLGAALLPALGALVVPGVAGAEPFTLSAPADGSSHWGPLVLAVVAQNRARPSGGYYCPPPVNENEICLGAAFVQGSAESIRYLSPRPAAWRYPGRFPQVRFIGGHAVRWVDAGLQLAILEQTESGYLWRVWSTSAEDDLVCLPREVIAHFRIQTRIRYRSHAGQENCFRLSALN